MRAGREGHGEVLLMGIFCTLCIFIADASLHLSFNLLRYLLETNLNNYLLPLAIAELSRSIKNKRETHGYTLFPSVIRRKTNERGSSLMNFLLSEEWDCMGEGITSNQMISGL